MDETEKMKLVLYIIKNLYSKNVRNGETTIQKLIYFIKQKSILDIDYNYILHNYGPFSFELSEDLKNLEENKVIKKIPHDSGFGFEYIINNENNITDSLLNKISFNSDKIDCLLSEFQDLSSKKLGLIATSNYINEKYQPENEEDLINLVWKVKPLFSKKEIKGTLDVYEKFIKSKDFEESIIPCSNPDNFRVV